MRAPPRRRSSGAPPPDASAPPPGADTRVALAWLEPRAMAEACGAGPPAEAPHPSHPHSYPHLGPNTAAQKWKPRSRSAGGTLTQPPAALPCSKVRKEILIPQRGGAGTATTTVWRRPERPDTSAAATGVGSNRLAFFPGHAPGHNATRSSAARTPAPSGGCSDTSLPLNMSFRGAERQGIWVGKSLDLPAPAQIPRCARDDTFALRRTVNGYELCLRRR